MSILLLCLIVIIVVALGCYAVSKLPIQAPFNGILQALIVLIGIVVIIERSGLLSGI